MPFRQRNTAVVEAETLNTRRAADGEGLPGDGAADGDPRWEVFAGFCRIGWA
jgi:hypothetical protein